MSDAQLLTRPLETELGDEAATFADRARRVLDATAVALLFELDPATGARRLIARAGTRVDVERLLADENWSPGEQAQSPNDEERPAASAVVETGELGERRISRPLRTVAGEVGTMTVLVRSTWPCDERTHRMIAALADTAAAMFGADGSPPGPLSQSERTLIAARILAELALTARSYSEMVGGITATVCPLVDAAKGGVAVWHERDLYLQMLSGSFGVPPEFVASSQAAPSDPNSPAGRVMGTGRPWYTNAAVEEMWGFRDFLRGFGVRRMAILPLVTGGRGVGVMHVANKREPFSDRDIRLLEAVTPLVAAVVEHVRRRLDLQRKEALALVVSDAATTIAAGQPLQGFAHSLRRFCESLGARMMVVSFVDGSPQIVVAPGDVDRAMAEVFRARSARGGFAVRTATKRPRSAGDIGWDALHVPVLLAGSREGTLSVLRIPSDPYSDDERAAVVRLANVTALAWATERYQQERAQMARLRERQRIADDLHDYVGQILYSAHLTLETVLERLDDDAPLHVSVTHARDLLVRSEVAIRDVITRLSSPAPTSLATRLGAIVQDVEEGFGVQIHLEVAPARLGVHDALPRSAADAALAAAREAMINAAKHAGPCRILVELAVTPRMRLHITVVDDGIGPAGMTHSHGYGLGAIRRRIKAHGGTLRVSRGVHGGTRVLVSLPMERDPVGLSESD
ncbi:MAG TPA: GAF domain-containing protein [Solirubrobacteraceae bacterium]|nr:GAF domain-containing protein [Solirubrobacteraceae bacterium]